MQENNIQREDIHTIAGHSNLTEESVARALQEHVYNDKVTWHKFLRLLFISLGVGFAVSGVVFFFAYNWDDLHKFVKIGLTEGLLVAATAAALLTKHNENISKVILTGAAVLVGVLLAVFGQIYQTGANAFDFFLTWTIFVTLWALISKFAPLLLLYLVLINATIILYSQQIAGNWSAVFICALLLIINVVVLICAISFGKKSLPNWFLNTVALASAAYATFGIAFGIFDQYTPTFTVLIIITSLLFAGGILYGLKTKGGFYLSVIPFSLIIIVSALLIKINDGELMFLFVSLFIIAGVTLTIKNLIDLQKKWTHEK